MGPSHYHSCEKTMYFASQTEKARLPKAVISRWGRGMCRESLGQKFCLINSGFLRREESVQLFQWHRSGQVAVIWVFDSLSKHYRTSNPHSPSLTDVFSSSYPPHPDCEVLVLVILFFCSLQETHLASSPGNLGPAPILYPHGSGTSLKNKELYQVGSNNLPDSWLKCHSIRSLPLDS